jgi:hypothetical protein
VIFLKTYFDIYLIRTFYFDWERAHVEDIYGTIQTRKPLISWMKNKDSCHKKHALALVEHNSEYESCECYCPRGFVGEKCDKLVNHNQFD